MLLLLPYDSVFHHNPESDEKFEIINGCSFSRSIQQYTHKIQDLLNLSSQKLSCCNAKNVYEKRAPRFGRSFCTFQTLPYENVAPIFLQCTHNSPKSSLEYWILQEFISDLSYAIMETKFLPKSALKLQDVGGTPEPIFKFKFSAHLALVWFFLNTRIITGNLESQLGFKEGVDIGIKSHMNV